MPLTHHSLASPDIHSAVKSLIHNLVHIVDTTGEFLLTLPDGRVIDTKGWNDWEWTHGIGLYGIWQYYTLTNDKDCLNIIKDWFKNRFDAGGTTKNINTMSVFLTLAYLYEETGDKTYLPWLDSWGEWAMWELERTTKGGMQHVTYLTPNTQQLWDDTLMMTVMPLAKIGLVLNRPHYVEEAKRQFLIHIQYLFNTRTGLFHHGWQFDTSAPGGVGHNFAEAAWGRGNSWITIVIPEFIELLGLPEGDALRWHLESTLLAQCEALLKYQDPESGLWRTILDDSDPSSYLEASATAGFAFGMLKSVRKRYLPKDRASDFEAAAVKAVKGVLQRIDDKGELKDVSFGTPMGETKDFYKTIPLTSMPYGQAMGMLCLGEFLRGFY